MAYDLGSARGVIELDYNGRGVTEAQKDLDTLEGKGASSAGKLAGVGRAAGIAGAAVAAGFAVGVNAAADFESRLSGIQAVSGATGQQMDAIRAKALQLGKDTAFSASESAQAIEELIKAGVSIPDVLNGAADAAVNLAAAAGVSVPEAATVMANAMNVFSIKGRDAAKVADLFAGAANASASDVSGLAQAMQQVGPAASQIGMSLQDTLNALALLSNAGVNGSDAGTSLKTMLQNLQPTTKKQAEEFRKLGLITKDGANKFFDAHGRIKSLAEISGVLNKALGDLNPKQRAFALNVLFGSDASRAASVLLKENTKGVNDMNKAMTKVKASDVAAKRLDNFNGSLEQMKGSLETAGIAVGTVLLPALRTVVDGVSGVFNAFLALPKGVQAAITIFTAVVGVLLLVVAAVIKVVQFVKAAQAALIAIRAVMATTWIAALGPIALVIAAIAAVVAAVVILWKKSETFRSIVIGTWNAIQAAAQAVANWFTGTLVASMQRAWQQLMTGLAAVGNFFKTVWSGLKSIVSSVLGFIASIIKGYIGIWVGVIGAGLHAILAVWRAVWGLFGPLVRAVFGLIKALVQLNWAILKGLFLAGLHGILTVSRAVWNAIAAVVRAVWGVIRAVVVREVNGVKKTVSAVWHAIQAVSRAVWNAIMAVIRAVWSRIGGTVTGAANRVKSVVTGAWHAVESVTKAVWNAVVGVIRAAVGRIAQVAGSIKDHVVGALKGAGSWLFNAGKEIIQGLINGITSMINAVTAKIHELTSIIKDHLPGSPVKRGPLMVLNRGHAGQEIVGMLIDGIADMARPLADAMSGVTLNAVPLAASHNSAPVLQTIKVVGGGGGSASRLVKGTLDLSPSGRAFISGVASDVVDDHTTYLGNLGRMSG